MSAKPLHLEIFTDFICPWCYLGSGVVARLQKKLPLQIKWSLFPLNPRIPPQGMLLQDMLPHVDLGTSHRKLAMLAGALDLPYGGQRTRIYNSRLAQELAAWALTQPGGEALLPLLYQAYFVHERNLADAVVLLPLVHQAGLDVDAAGEVLQKGTFSDEVDASWQRARQLQISGIPTFLAGEYQLTGYNPEEELRRFVEFVQTKDLAAN